MGKIRQITSTCVRDEAELTQEQIEEIVREEFPGEARLYLEMDDQVLLGRYDRGTWQVRTDGQGIQNAFPWENVQKVIIFDEEQELRLVRRGLHFCGRLRRDVACGSPVYVMDEEQKMWGEGQRADEAWSVLKSSRGASIWVPEVLGRDGGAMGLRVRKYFEFPDATEKRGLVSQIDERLLGFCPWPDNRGCV